MNRTGSALGSMSPPPTTKGSSPPTSRVGFAPTASTIPSDSAAFQLQLDHLNASQAQVHHANFYGQQVFDLGGLAHNLPQAPQLPLHLYGQQYAQPMHPAMQQANVMYQMQPHGFAASPPGVARPQPQFLQQPYGMNPQQPRPPIPHMQNPGQFNPMHPYGFAPGPPSLQHMDMRFVHPTQYGMPPPMVADPSQYVRRTSEPAPVPALPRGPPRKPKQSGHALWVGNLPPAATVTDLKDHFSREATDDIESLFLISKSNCAFVNYRTEAACAAAMNRFHDSRFNGVRLVCRLRRGAANGPAPAPAPASTSLVPPTNETSSSDVSLLSSPAAQHTSSATSNSDPSPSPLIVDGSPKKEKPAVSTVSDNDTGNVPERVPDKYFIVKSLTVQDLESSVRNGIWATQSHNEITLNQAYGDADNVFLIFSANKSGEYFGYARMASTISGKQVHLNPPAAATEASATGTPQSIHTPATDTAPPGRIIDDSARGTIFWEAERIAADEEEAPEEAGESWGRQFSIEWLSTARLPFYRTRGLRNPWNSNREVKIARDGTELETNVGRRLVQMFHRPSPGPGEAHLGMQYR